MNTTIRQALLIALPLLLQVACETDPPTDNPPPVQSSVELTDLRNTAVTRVLQGDTALLVLAGPVAEATDLAVAFSADSGTTWNPAPALSGLALAAVERAVEVPILASDRTACRFRATGAGDTVTTTLFAAKHLLLVKPTGGESFHDGDTLWVDWRATGAILSVLAVFLDERGNETMITEDASVARGDPGWGHYPWVVPATMPTTSFRVQVSEYETNFSWDRTEVPVNLGP